MLRTLYKADMSSLVVIERSVQPVPWTEETFKTCFQAGHIGWVMERDKQVIGFILVSMRVEECHILNLCVAREHQHQGLGRQLLEQAITQAKQQGAGVVYLEVRQSNSRAIGLYRQAKFHLIGMRKDYYPTLSGNEDALVFAKNLTSEER